MIAEMQNSWKCVCYWHISVYEHIRWRGFMTPGADRGQKSYEKLDCLFPKLLSKVGHLIE